MRNKPNSVSVARRDESVRQRRYLTMFVGAETFSALLVDDLIRARAVYELTRITVAIGVLCGQRDTLLFVLTLLFVCCHFT